MPRRKELSFSDDQINVDLVIVEATAMTAMKRAVYAGRAEAYVKALNTTIEEDGPAAAGGLVAVQAKIMLVRIFYPDLLASAQEITGLDPDMKVEEFLDLPQALTDAWQNLTYELNPHWNPFRGEEDETEDEQKKDESENAESSSEASASN
ncbi:MAG: hypothetical protein GVY30_00195 [Chloroflexi bacterium]|jgi:hypothetical protein|nr:hypothetical protein [Chloroflexota bacterium]